MKLTQEQIQYIFNYVTSFDIKWYELQVELTDHMVSSMEEIWEKDPKLTFHQVKQYAENKFVGYSSFKSIEEERTKILRKEFRKAQWKMVAKYLKFPKIIGSILLAFVAFKCSFYFDNTSQYILVLFASSFIFMIPMIYLWIMSRKIDGKRFLAIESANPVWTLLVFPQLGMNLSTQVKEELLGYQWLVLLFCCFWVVGILFMITGIHLQKKTVENIKKQYQLS